MCSEFSFQNQQLVHPCSLGTSKWYPLMPSFQAQCLQVCAEEKPCLTYKHRASHTGLGCEKKEWTVILRMQIMQFKPQSLCLLSQKYDPNWLWKYFLTNSSSQSKIQINRHQTVADRPHVTSQVNTPKKETAPIDSCQISSHGIRCDKREHLIPTSPSLGCWQTLCIILFNLHNIPLKEDNHFLRFTDEETKTWEVK